MNLRWKQYTWLLCWHYFIIFMDKYIPGPYGSVHILGRNCEHDLFYELLWFHWLQTHSLSLHILQNTIHVLTLIILLYYVKCLTSETKLHTQLYFFSIRHNDHIFSIEVRLKLQLTGGGNSSRHCLSSTM